MVQSNAQAQESCSLSGYLSAKADLIMPDRGARQSSLGDRVAFPLENRITFPLENRVAASVKITPQQTRKVYEAATAAENSTVR